MNRQWTEDELYIAELLQDLQRKIGSLHITDESFLENVQAALPELKQLLEKVKGSLE
ncbi:hypothetical protein M1K46_20500 [Fictibacillus sp. WQ 8-8]|uniref:hypothetical protein n=1 Tax=unclassified Fictibacillus TaxID=2644029 RepID=UPI0008E0660A|nr:MULTISPECIES: hypothetical protein [unclassified Fictibacillus]MCQ6268005.1 hypothetical protein [Fictibacillus sp. WQ 8-8]MED2971238.1 hypothetical protein [Fictibacillus sp. B-59209]UZJ80056.1 hypothetical protein OKX00_06190 [Fictibacillus sp. KU28468]SFD50785.1 hypothetical protein SAMN05428981_101698 [Bacillus sp. OV194]